MGAAFIDKLLRRCHDFRINLCHFLCQCCHWQARQRFARVATPTLKLVAMGHANYQKVFDDRKRRIRTCGSATTIFTPGSSLSVRSPATKPPSVSASKKPAPFLGRFKLKSVIVLCNKTN
jgi:hypothetical protein